MSRILKSTAVSMNADERVRIEINDYITPKSINIGSMVIADDEELTQEKLIEMAKIEADQIVSNAQSEAKKMISESKTQAEVLAKDIFDRAEKEGYETGYNQGLSEAEAIKQEAEQLYSDTVEEREQMISSAEPELFELIVNILDKLFGDTIEINPQVIICLIRQGIMGSNMTGDISIHVSDEDYEVVMEQKNSILELVSSSAKVQIIRDVSLKKSDCIIETSFGNIECSFDTQYTELKRNLYYIHENR